MTYVECQQKPLILGAQHNPVWHLTSFNRWCMCDWRRCRDRRWRWSRDWLNLFRSVLVRAVSLVLMKTRSGTCFLAKEKTGMFVQNDAHS